MISFTLLNLLNLRKQRLLPANYEKVLTNSKKFRQEQIWVAIELQNLGSRRKKEKYIHGIQTSKEGRISSQSTISSYKS